MNKYNPKGLPVAPSGRPPRKSAGKHQGAIKIGETMAKTKKRLTAAEKRALKLKEKKDTKPSSLQNPKTRRLAIHSFCHECIYDPSCPGGWRRQVEECTATKCPLYNFRPMTIAAEKAKSK